MKNFKCLILMFFLGTMSAANAQKIKELPLHVSYYGENGIHPGLKLGTSYNFWSKEKSKICRFKSKQNKYGNKTKFKELDLDYNIGFYSHPNNHLGLLTNIGVSYLRVKERKGRMFGYSFEIGYLRRVNKFTTYELNSNGEVTEVKLAGNNAMVLSLSPVFGKEFMISDQIVRFFVEPMLQLLTYNERMQLNACLEIGMTFNINRN